MSPLYLRIMLMCWYAFWFEGWDGITCSQMQSIAKVTPKDHHV